MLYHSVTSWAAWLLILSFQCSFQCSGSEVPRVTLSVRHTVPIDLAVGVYQAPIKCDLDGNLYVRSFRDANPLTAPVLKMGHDGKLVASFSFENIGDSDDRLEALDFSIGSRGE